MGQVSRGGKRKLSWLGLFASLAVALLLALNLALSAFAAPGDLDTNFGTGGKVITDFFGTSDSAYAVVIQSDGKIVAAGINDDEPSNRLDFALSRYSSNGSLDPSFHTDGKVTTDFFGGDDGAYAVAIQSDGKIVAAGRNGLNNIRDFALARYNSNGSLDTTFSDDGELVTDFADGLDEAHAVAIQSDGKIVAAGSTTGPSRVYFALARYYSDGSPDTTFGGGDGLVTTDFGVNATGLDIAIQSDGKIVVVG